MASLNLICFLALGLCCVWTHGAVRVARSPQFGGFSQAQAQAQAQAGGGGFGGPGAYPHRPFFGPPRPPFGGLGGSGFGRSGGAVSISKSVSINIGGRGGAQSSASSSAGGFGK